MFKASAILLVGVMCFCGWVIYSSQKTAAKVNMIELSDTHVQFFKDQWLACYNYQPRCLEYSDPVEVEESSKFWKSEWEKCVASLEPCFREGV